MPTSIICVPVYNLELSSDIGSEIIVDGVTIVSKNKMHNIRRRLGFNQRISEIEKNYSQWLNHSPFDKETYALIKWNLKDNEKPYAPLRKIKEALFILASSLFSASNRALIEPFGLPGHELANLHSYFIFDTSSKASRASFRRSPPFERCRLDSQWSSIVRHHFFPEVLKIIEGKYVVDENWKKQIRKATIFAGRSILTQDLNVAFMYDMIAIESILTGGEGKHREALKERLYALLTWYFDRSPGHWEEIIDELYTLRNNLIHDGTTEGIKPINLIYSDILLDNLLWNIAAAHKIIKNQSDLIELSKTIKAKQHLGLKIKHQFRGRFSEPSVIAHIIKRIEKNME